MDLDPKQPTVEQIIAWSREIAFEEGYVGFTKSADTDLIEVPVFELPEPEHKMVRRPTPWTMLQDMQDRDEALQSNPDLVALAHERVDEQLHQHGLTEEAFKIQDDLTRKLALLHNRTRPRGPPPKPEVTFFLLKRGDYESDHQPWGHVEWLSVHFTTKYPWHAVEAQLRNFSKWWWRDERQSNPSPFICAHVELLDCQPHLANMVPVTSSRVYEEAVLKIHKDRRYHTAIFFQVDIHPSLTPFCVEI